MTNQTEALALLTELRSALWQTYSLSPEGRAYIARIDAALSSQPPAPSPLPDKRVIEVYRKYETERYRGFDAAFRELELEVHASLTGTAGSTDK